MYTMDHGCTVYRTMDYLAKKWTVMILLELYKGGRDWKRFSVIRGSMKDVTSKILSERLKEIEREGLIEKRVDASCFPVKSEYRLTEMGTELVEAVKNIKCWALKWKIKNEACRNQDCSVCIL